jgi:hypothetical protein
VREVMERSGIIGGTVVNFVFGAVRCQ